MAKLPKALTRKVGPLPVWAWASVVALAGWYYLKHRSATSAATPVPVTSTTSGDTSGAQQVGGGGGPADNSSSDLLDALLANQKASYDALLSALQYGGAGGVGAGGANGSVPEGFGGGGVDTSTTTAPTVDSGTNNAPVTSFVEPSAPIDSTPIWITPTASQASVEEASNSGLGGQLTGVQVGGQTTTLPYVQQPVVYPTYTLDNPDAARPIHGAVGQV